MSNTTQLESTLVQLESLYTAYNELLCSAKEQLATLEVDDSNLKRISEICLTDRTFRGYIKEQISTQLAERIQEILSNDTFVELIDTRIKDLIKESKAIDEAATLSYAVRTIFTTLSKESSKDE